MKSADLPSVIAHRGSPFEAVENTAEAFLKALESPIAGIECDIQISEDSVPLVFHDPTLERLANDTSRVWEQSWSELEKVRLANGERILTLEKLLEDFAQKTCFLLEIKPNKEMPLDFIADMILKITNTIKANEPEQFHVLCFEERVLREMHRMQPQWSYVLNMEGEIDADRYLDAQFDYISHWSLNYKDANKQVVNSARSSGKDVMTWTCDDEEAVKHVQDCGINQIMTNKPGWLCNYLKQ